ncbi:inter-alpha-trypsin inhibitor heavy chain H4-like isoform X2 [Homalodisca vitripennis]|uniref:inter-alpha-trypsin inhibitor heavy chain H4-like isoform X2 n=1 Tax=Homalodisca vitripennis TaxID=197043 RepID=UPI001EEC219F|nr:inter-alpha-trypsin inhibitor heavy chain H4-like isoform X2 [Homalodisca vitripennis]
MYNRRMWSMPLCLLLVLGIHFSTQDMVTLAPSEGEAEVPEPDSTTPKLKVKPIIRSLHITSDIKYRYATTLVSSRVVNPSDQAGEAVFYVTLPESAFISEFLMEVKDKVYKAYVKEKEEAKAVYDQAVQAGQFAGHVALDARDSNQFSVSVNIEAHGKVTFNLTYEQLLSRNLGVYTNTININPSQIVEDMSVTVNIEEPTAIKDLEVPELQISNEVVVDKPNSLAKIEEKSPTHKVVVWAPTPEEQKSQNATGLSGQFVVKYDVDRESNPQQILVDEGYFVHFFAPEDLPQLKKHIVFVLDYSGSMGGRKLEQLKEAMDKILSDLSPKDHFSIVVFQSYVEAWSPTAMYSSATEHLSRWDIEAKPEIIRNTTLDKRFVIEATPENIASARAYLGNYSDLGATNIMGGLRTGLELVSIGSDLWSNESDPPQPVVVFLTDGEPNVEEYNTDAIINKTKPLNTKDCPIFSLAFGYGADFNFLRKLSLSNYGFARNIYEAADATDQLKNFYKTISSPLLSNVTFTYLPGQVDNSSRTKIDFPVFFNGSELVVAGKINNNEIKEKETIGELSGLTANGFHRYPIIIDFIPIIVKPKNRTFGHLEKTWAYLTIQQLLDKADSLDKTEERNQTKEKALNLALQYSFVTPLTSLVVVKPNETESAVDTTQVKPGSNDMLGYAPVGVAAFGASPGGFGGSAGGLSSSSGSSANWPQYSLAYTPMPAYKPQSTPYYPPALPAMVGESADVDMGSMNKEAELSTVVAEPLHTTKITLDEVEWLHPLLMNSTDSSIIPVTVDGKQYNLGLNQTDVSFGACQVNGETGECHHIQYCALKVFQVDVLFYLPYQCPITGEFLGVCCPKVTS